MSIDEFMSKYENTLKNGIIEEGCIGDFFDVILEANKSEKREILSYIRLIYLHMLKYLYQPDHQTSSWIKTIRNSYRYLEDAKYESKNIWNSISDSDIERQYKNGRQDAIIETNLPDKTFSKEFPSADFELDSISSGSIIESFLRHNAYTKEVKKYLNIL